MIAIPIILGVMIYLTVLGYIGPKIRSFAYDRRGLNMGTSDGASCFAFFSCLLLPVFAPIILGLWLSKHNFEPRENRISRKQAKEIKGAEHRKELARINAETIAIKEREAGIR